MKYIKLISIFTFLIFTATSYAQQNIVPLEQRYDGTKHRLNDVYYKDVNNYLGKFLGTWLYDDGVNYLQITFIKKYLTESIIRNRYSDELVCEYLFKINNVVIYDTYGANSNINDYLANLISGSKLAVSNFSYNIMKNMSYSEPHTTNCRRSKGGLLQLEFVSGFPLPKLIWTRENKYFLTNSHPCANGTLPDMTDFLIPENMVLEKQP